MNIFKNWMLVSDIDGTLIGEDCVLHDTDIQTIKRFIKDDGTMVLATGRSFDSAKRFYDQLGLKTPIICNNGTAIYDFETDSFLYTDPIKKEALELIEYVLEHFPEAGIEIYGLKDIYVLRYNQMVNDHIARESLTVTDCEPGLVPHPWCKILFAVDPSLMSAFREFVAASPYKNRYLFCQSAPYFYEASNLFASKGKAVSRLTEKLGFETQKLITIGDNENDVKMLLLTPHSFAVGNAIGYASEAAQHQTTACGHTGGAVAEAIQTMREIIEKKGYREKAI